MESQNKMVPLVACLAGLLVAVILVVVLLPMMGGSAGAVPGQVYVSEVLSSNRTYPAPDGRLLDYVELHNPNDHPVDISGFVLSDEKDTVGYTFPKDSVIPAGGYILCWCDPEDTTDQYAAFGISRRGGETLYLYSKGNALLDRVEIPPAQPNMPFIRMDDGGWQPSDIGTPGFSNTQQGYDQWLRAMGADALDVVISEVMTANTCTVLADHGPVTDWVELWNRGEKTAVLDGGFLSDDPADPMKWQIPALTLEPGARAVIRCAGTGAGVRDASFSLARQGCTLVLTGPLGNPLHQVQVPQLPGDHSWAMQPDSGFAVCADATPGQENTPQGYKLWLREMGASGGQVVISEVMTRNRATLRNRAGQLCDWVELYNPGDETAVLDGAYLSDDPENRSAWAIPSLTLEPGERAVICCSGPDAEPGEASFSLSGDGCTLVLTNACGGVITSVTCPRLEDDRSYALLADGSYAVTQEPTPGYANTEEGYSAWKKTQLPLGDLGIWEVMSTNDRYLLEWGGDYFDWVELKNLSAEPLALSQYALATDLDAPFYLPEQTLQPGERVIIICSGDTTLPSRHIHAPFTLNGQEEWVYLVDRAGNIQDMMHVTGLPYQGSMGRSEADGTIAYFATATPGQPNSPESGSALAAAAVFDTRQGIYNGVDRVDVAISGPGRIRYTLDGSLPTENSALYTGPIPLTATTVVRAACFEDGKLPGPPVTASYIINENHTMPVVSLAADPGRFQNMYTNFSQPLEVPCSFTLLEQDGTGTSINGGVEMHGYTGLKLPKKSFKINFRAVYGEKYLSYPVFGEDGPLVYESLCMRAGQDHPQAMIREELFTTLCADMSDSVLVQKYRYCVLYINGQYWGIYSLKEAFSETYYAQNHGVSQESVSVAQAPVLPHEEMYGLIRYIDRHDMTLQEHYDYIAQRIDLDSLIDWIIIQGYCTNGDVQQNLRYFKSSENGNRWQLAFYDLDWAWYRFPPFKSEFSYDTLEEWQHTDMCVGMMKNPRFRQRFFQRLSGYMDTVLSNDYVSARIDSLVASLSPEIPREKARWGGSYDGWLRYVDELRVFVADDSHLRSMVICLRDYVGLTWEETRTYFAKWAN